MIGRGRSPWLAVGLIVACVGAAQSQPGPAPAPAGTLLRLGSERMFHGDSVGAVAYSPDGRLLATGGGDRGYSRFGEQPDSSIRFWEVGTSKTVRQLAGHANGVTRLAFAPSGKFFASTGRDGLIKVWETATGKARHQLKGQPNVGANTLVFSPDSRLLVFDGPDRTVHLVDAASGREIGALPLNRTGYASAVFAPDGQTLATGGNDGTVRLWDVQSGEQRLYMQGHRQQVNTLAFTADGQRIASASTDGSVLLWEAATGKVLHRLAEAPVGPDQFKNCALLAFLDDGQTLLGGWNNGSLYQLWDTTTGKAVRSVRTSARYGGQSWQTIAPDGKTVALGSWNGGQIHFWDVASGREPAYTGHELEISAAVYSPDGRTLATGSHDRTIRLWDVATGKEIRCLRGHVDSVDHLMFSPDGKQLASGGSSDLAISLWDVASGKELRQFRGFLYLAAMSFSPDGQVLMAAGTDNADGQQQVVWLWDVATGAENRRFAISPGGRSVFSPDGKWLAAVVNSNDGNANQLVLYSVESGKEQRHLYIPAGGSVGSIVFAPDSKHLAGGGQNQNITDQGQVMSEKFIGIWEVTSGQLVHQQQDKVANQGLRYFGNGLPVQLAFSPDGRLLATTGGMRNGHAIELWELATGKLRRQYPGHQRQSNVLAFAPNGRALASGSGDASALLWDAFQLGGVAQRANLTDKELIDLDTDLISPDASKAFRAIVQLSAAPQQALLHLQQGLPAVPHVDAKVLRQLTQELDNDSFPVRKRAEDELEKLAELARPALEKVLMDRPSLEVRQRVERLLNLLYQRTLPPAQVRAVRGIEVLERIGTPEARQVLTALAQGAPGARVTVEAQQALERLAK